MPAAAASSDCSPTLFLSDGVWLDKFKYQDAERQHYERLAKLRKWDEESRQEVVVEVGQNGMEEEVELALAEEEEAVVVAEAPEQQAEEVALSTPPTPPQQPPQQPPPSQQQAQPKEAKEKRNKASRKGRHRTFPKDKGAPSSPSRPTSIASQIAKAREHIKNSLECVENIATAAASGRGSTGAGPERLDCLEKANASLKSDVEELRRVVQALQERVKVLEDSSAPAPPKQQPKKDDDDELDLFGTDSEEEDADAAKVREQRLAEYAAKKSKKPTLIAKSSVVLDVKPWDDETDMKELEKCVRAVQMDGLVWGQSKLVPLAYGIHKLQIACVVEDEKISMDWLTETIQENEDYVQSVDIFAFNKV